MKMTINVDGYGLCHVETVDVEGEHISLRARIALPTRVDDLGIPWVCECGEGCEWCDVTGWQLYLSSGGYIEPCAGEDVLTEAPDVAGYDVEEDRPLTDAETRDAVAVVAAEFAPVGV